MLNARSIDSILKWQSGTLIKIPNTKKCIFSQDRNEVPKNIFFQSDDGQLFRIVEKLIKINDHEVLITTKSMDIFDYFEDADITHFYKSSTSKFNRKKRSIIKSIPASFDHIRQKFKNMNYTFDRSTSIDINYDEKTGKAEKEFEIFDGAFRFNKEKFFEVC